jgi:hypothetical protein
MAKKRSKRKTGLARLPGYERPMRPKEKVNVDSTKARQVEKELEDIQDHFDLDQLNRHARDLERRRKRRSNG